MGDLKNKRLTMLRQADLYVVITEEFTAGRGTLRVLEEAADAGIRIAQLREKPFRLPMREMLSCRAVPAK